MASPLLADCGAHLGSSRFRDLPQSRRRRSRQALQIDSQLIRYTPPNPSSWKNREPHSDFRSFLRAFRKLRLQFSDVVRQVKLAMLEPSSGSSSPGDLKLPLNYDPEAIAKFFKSRPGEVVFRLWSVAWQCSVFVLNIMLDKSLGKLQENENTRAAELLKLITRLGPTAIKIGQALSIRPDLISLAYMEQLQKLQDKVPPFSNKLAMQIIQRELGDDVFSEISQEPVAAGSLGQVYKGRLKSTGDEVAIKVQRPGILRVISCDLLILRQTLSVLHRLSRVDSSFIELLDSWAARCFDELDYNKEASNAVRFSKDMSSVPMILTPEVFMEYTTCQVLTTRWIYVEKLSEIKQGDVLSLVNTALTCYLMQLLDSGFLHADPHPGNLFRAPDGRLCILDYGLMTEVTEEQQLAMVEYLAHVFNSDYAAVAQDLVKLGFLPSDGASKMIVPEIAQIFTELVRGGGARKLDMKLISDGILKISQEFRLVIPPYFSLIIRAFTLLEGIALDIDPDYTIFRECYPYISKRLLTDDSHRTRKVLKYFLYTEKNQLNVKRLETILSSFEDFHRQMSTEKSSSTSEATTKQTLLILLDPKGSFIQELVLAEFVRLADALSRTAWLQVWHFYASVFNFPLLVPGVGVTPLSEDDLNALETMQRLWPHLQPYLFSPQSGTALASLTRQIIPLIPELFPGASIFAQKFVIMFMQRQALRYADGLTGKSTGMADWNEDPARLARRLPWAAGKRNAGRSLGKAPS